MCKTWRECGRSITATSAGGLEPEVHEEIDLGSCLSSTQRTDDSAVSKPLEDMFPFLDREEFLANMIVNPLPE